MVINYHLAVAVIGAALFSLYVLPTAGASRPCIARSFPDGQVCVCNATYCDTLDEPLIPSLEDQIIVLTSGADGSRFVVTNAQFSKNDRQVIKFNGTENVIDAKITVNEATKFQSIIGFGGAHTGAVTYLLQQLPQSLQDFIYESYYSPTKGIGYTLTRVPIGGCDFDLSAWAYNEKPVHDKKLSNFTKLDRRDLDKVEQMKRIKLVSGQKNIKYLGSAWSSPPWMKSNNAWTGLSTLKPQYYDTWANYHVRFLSLMKKAGIDFWAITTGNEPLNGNIFEPFIDFMSLGWTSTLQGKWVGESLGPLLRASDVSNVKIFAGDDQRYTFPWFFQEMEAANPYSLDYVDGFATHFYTDSYVPPHLLDDTKRLYPDKVIINSESCVGVAAGDVNHPVLGSWPRAETYILSYIQDLEHSVSAWIDWNLILDLTGGPNYVNNTVEAPVISNAADGEIYKQPIFYAIGHFSRFITEGSVRIDVTTSNEMVKTLGFRRPDGHVVLIFYNRYILPIDLFVVDDKRKVTLTIAPQSIKTVVYRSLNLY